MAQMVGTVASLARYPVKGMAGCDMPELFVGFAGVYCDRLYALHDADAPPGFPFFTARELSSLLLYRPRFHADQAAAPGNLAAAEAMAPGMTPVHGPAAALALDVATPEGAVLDVQDPALLASIQSRMSRPAALTLMRSERAQTDCRPVSIFSMQTLAALGEALEMSLDKRRFRANVYADLDMAAFGERALVGRRLRIGEKLELAVLDHDPRCKMITLDPDTGEAAPQVLRHVARNHSGEAGLYAAVLVEGMAKAGDPIALLD